MNICPKCEQEYQAGIIDGVGEIVVEGKQDCAEDSEDDRRSKQIKFALLEGTAESNNISFGPIAYRHHRIS